MSVLLYEIDYSLYSLFNARCRLGDIAGQHVGGCGDDLVLPVYDKLGYGAVHVPAAGLVDGRSGAGIIADGQLRSVFLTESGGDQAGAMQMARMGFFAAATSLSSLATSG